MYKITFSDGEIWQGGSIENSKWNEMPIKPIQSLNYTLSNKIIILENYEAYNHLIERIYTLDGRQYTTKIILLAKKENNVFKFEFDFLKRKINFDILTFGKEYYGRSTSGWKQGIKGIPNYKIIDNNED